MINKMKSYEFRPVTTFRHRDSERNQGREFLAFTKIALHIHTNMRRRLAMNREINLFIISMCSCVGGNLTEMVEHNSIITN